MTKLTNPTRISIASRLVEYTFKKIEAEIVEERNALADKVYDYLVPQDVREIMCKVPENYFPHKTSYYVNAGGWNVFIANGPSYEIWADEDKFKRYYFPEYISNIMRPNITNGLLVAQLQSYAAREKKMEENKSSFKRKVMTNLQSLSTVNMFKEAYPEWQTFLPEDFFGVKKVENALAVTTKDIMCTVAMYRNEPREGCP